MSLDADVMGTVMMGMVVAGMALSVFQLIAEIVARGRLAAVLANRDEVTRQLYVQQPAQQDSRAQALQSDAPPSKAAA